MIGLGIGGVMRIFGVGVMDVVGTLGGFCVGGSGGSMVVFGETIEAKGSVTISSGELKYGEAVSAKRVLVVSWNGNDNSSKIT